MITKTVISLIDGFVNTGTVTVLVHKGSVQEIGFQDEHAFAEILRLGWIKEVDLMLK